MTEKLETIRTAFADYVASEGCSCCQNREKHNEAARVLAGLLNVPMYDDGSGYNFLAFVSDDDLRAKLVEKLT